MILTRSALRTEAFLIIRYGIAGGLAIAIQAGGLYLWVSVFGLAQWYLAGVVLAFLIALTVAFLLQKYWTFRDMAKETRRRQFVLYTTVALLNLILNITLLALAKEVFTASGIEFFEVWYMVVQLGTLGFGALLSFLANRLVTFRAPAA